MNNYHKIFENKNDEKKVKYDYFKQSILTKILIFFFLKRSFIPSILTKDKKKDDNEQQLSITESNSLSMSTNGEAEKPMPTDLNDRAYHDIKLHIEKIHNYKSEIEDPWLKKVESFNRLRKIVRKL